MRNGLVSSIGKRTMIDPSRGLLILLLGCGEITRTSGFAPPLILKTTTVRNKNWELAPITAFAPSSHILLRATESNDADDVPQNPYQDPNYPELEFIDYSDPDYQVDQGVSDEMFEEEDSTDEEIEAMREERRRRNDEFQFETYYRDVLREGKEYMGEWTVYRTSTFLQPDDSPPHTGDADALPQFRKARRNLKVKTKGSKVIVDPNAEWRVDGEYLCHEETLVPASDSDAYLSPDGGDDTAYADEESTSSPSEELQALTSERKQNQDELMKQTYWPEKMSSFDFRGQQGNMCVGNAYTICTAVPLTDDGTAEGDHDGPFSELRTEVGIQYDAVRFRVKFDYSVKERELLDAGEHPPLHLKSMIVCRETRDRWPRDGGKSPSLEDRVEADRLFGDPGAPGGLYDPPPVGSDEQAGCYMMLDLEGGASVLFPYIMDQSPDAFEGNGWVTSLDWTPGKIRFQVDRKVAGGVKLKGLRTLELSEVQGQDADTYRPRDGGQDMRQ